MQHKDSPSQQDPPIDALAATTPLVLSLAAVFALITAASFLPRAQLWGINHLAFYPLPARIAALALVAVAFVPPIARRLYAELLTLSKTLKNGGRGVDIALTVIAVASVVMFMGLKVSTNLLGDGQLIAQSYDAAWEGNDSVIMRSTKAIVTEERIAPGATLLYYGTAKAVTAAFDKGPVWGIRLFTCMLGAFFVYILLSLLRGGPFSPEIRLWLMMLALFSVTMQLFFGYVENYAPLVFFGFLYVLAGFLVLHDRGKTWVAVLLLVVSIYMHIQAVLFAPSLVYLIAWRTARKRKAAVERYAGPVLTFVTVAVAFVAGFTQFGGYYLPLRGNEQSYGLFSSLHFIDIFNEIVMLMPILPMLAVMAWMTRSMPAGGAARRGKSRDKSPGSTAWFTMTAEWQFVILILVPCFVYLFLFKPEIGMARDWDLFTMTSLGLVPLALLVLNRFLRATRMQSAAASFTSPALAIYVMLAISWIGINASPARSTARFERILEYDRTHAPYAYENLAIFYYESGRLDKATEMIEIACEISHNPRQYVRLAMYYNEQGRGEDAMELMRRTLEKHPDYGKARFYLVSLLEKRKLFDELLEVSRTGTKNHPEEAIYWFYLGEVSLRKGNVEEGLAAHKKCLTLNPPAKARERCMEQIRKYSENND
jgi:Tfp pilus assembly protein PilF